MADGTETEIKLRVQDLAAVRARLRKLGARPGPRLHEVNVLFDSPQGALRASGTLLRARVERPAARGPAPSKRTAKGEPHERAEQWMFPARGPQRTIVTWKGPSAETSSYKVRREIEFEATDSHALREVFSALGLAPAFFYEKIRTTYRTARIPGLVITVDETPVGVFLELEGRPKAIDRARKALGYRASDTILLSYGALYAADCAARGVPPTHMLFQ